MTDLKSRADELIAATGRAIGYDEVMEASAALARFVHALCDRLGECERSLYLYSGGTAEYFDRHPVSALEKGEKV